MGTVERGPSLTVFVRGHKAESFVKSWRTERKYMYWVTTASGDMQSAHSWKILLCLEFWPSWGTTDTSNLPSSCGHSASPGAGAVAKCAGDWFPVRVQTPPVCSVWWRSGDGPYPGSCPLGWARWWSPAAGGSNTPSPNQNVRVSPLVTACAAWG